jgi:hypothetical protein
LEDGSGPGDRRSHRNSAFWTVISKVVANRDAIRQRVVSFLTPEQLEKWDAEKAKAKDFLGQKIAA